MADNMLKAGFKGITWDSTYDAWTPARAYSHYHGGVRILSETASVNLATPINVKPEQLRAGEGYDARKATPNFPVLWPGGDWRLRDITNYMTTAAFELLKHAAQNSEAWLRRLYSIGRETVRQRRRGELWVFELVPSSKNYLFLVSALNRGGVAVDWCETGRRYKGVPVVSQFVRLAQPYGAFAKALLERQNYPDLRDAEGRPVPPYDVTAHTLSLMTDVNVRPINAPFRCKEADWDDENRLPVYKVDKRVALYKSHIPSLDEGWTRWTLEQAGAKYESIFDKEIRAGDLRAKYDAIIIPDQSPRPILEGYRKGSMPEEMTGGLGRGGVKALREFVEQGGTLVALNQASDFAIEQLNLPLRDVTAGLRRPEFYCHGSILRKIGRAHA